jgi:hypothetical protein
MSAKIQLRLGAAAAALQLATAGTTRKLQLGLKQTKPTRGVMNKLEQAWMNELLARQRAGELLVIRFEEVTLKLAHDVRYTPDFWTVTSQGLVRCYETKGWMRDDARVKLRVAAAQFPEFEFVLVQRKNRAWLLEPVESPLPSPHLFSS